MRTVTATLLSSCFILAAIGLAACNHPVIQASDAATLEAGSQQAKPPPSPTTLIPDELRASFKSLDVDQVAESERIQRDGNFNSLVGKTSTEAFRSVQIWYALYKDLGSAQEIAKLNPIIGSCCSSAPSQRVEKTDDGYIIVQSSHILRIPVGPNEYSDELDPNNTFELVISPDQSITIGLVLNGHLVILPVDATIPPPLRTWAALNDSGGNQ